MTFKKFFHHHKSALAKSIERKLFQIGMLDFLYWVFFIGLFVLYNYLLNEYSPLFKQVNFELFPDRSLAILILLVQKFLLYSIIFIIAVIAIYSIIKSYVWSLISSKKIEFIHIVKFFWINIIWNFIFVMLFVLAMVSLVDTAVVFVTVLLAFAYFFLQDIFFICFFESKHMIGHSIKKFFKIIISKIHHLFLSFLMIYLVFNIFFFFSSVIPLSGTVLLSLVGVFFLVFLAWSKNYVYKVVSDFLKDDRN